jgi:hypothetical protein
LSIARRTIAAAIVAATAVVVPALADGEMSGEQAQKLLAGQRFDFHCVDGTRGEASYAHSGIATASYRLSSSTDEAALLKDQGRVRMAGNMVCIRWNNLNSGEEGCFRMTERQPGRYRIATEDKIRWCDLSVRGTGERAERN